MKSLAVWMMPMALVCALAACKGKDAAPAPASRQGDDATTAKTPGPAGPLGDGCWGRASCAAACSEGAPGACAELAIYQDRGWGAAAAGELENPLSRGCEAGDAAACVRVAAVLREGDPGYAEAQARARRTSDAACEAGDGAGCLAWPPSAQGTDSPGPAEIARWVKACAAGSVHGCHRVTIQQLNVLLGDGEVASLPAGAAEAAERTLRERCLERRDAVACYFLLVGDATLDAVATQARQVFDARCEAGHPPSCALLGEVGVLRGEADDAVAAFRRACDAGLSESCARVKATDPALSGIFRVTRHALNDGACAAEETTPESPAKFFRVTASAPPAPAGLTVEGCASAAPESCGQDFDVRFTTRDEDGFAVAVVNRLTVGRPCTGGEVTLASIAVGEGEVALVRERWGTPEGEHPELCSALAGGDTEDLVCRGRETLVGERVEPTR